MGRQTSVTLPDNSVTTTGYDLRGNVISQGGSQQYEVTYTFDAQGRMATMTTTGQAGIATTTWNYDPQRGWLTSKVYADGKGTDYTYTPAGRLATRTWERGITTSYSYNAAGDLTLTDYSDATPDVSMTYTRFGALESMTDATGTRTISYNANLQPSGETFPTAFFGGRILTRSYDSLNRPTGFVLGTSADPDADHAVTYGYDTAGRLATVQDPSRTWTYAFVPNTPSLLSGVTSGNFAVTYTYEPGRNAITSVENKVGGNTVSQFTYTNNALGQRTTRSQSGSAFAAAATEDFGYNAKGEVISSTHSLDPLRDTIYDYDGIGNRNEATFGGITTAYTANALNQYTEIDPGTPATPTYDEDGNMLSDGADKRLVWDGENRLIEVRDANDNLIATYTYDGQSRRVKKVTTSLAPQGATEEVYLYDGWNRIATYSISNSTFQISNSLTWGRDLSGSLEGAGGVGGLLGISDLQTSNSYAVAFDANGNVSEMIDSAGTIAAHYEYDSFGNVVVVNGSYAAANPWRFSTKPVDQETGYSYYGYRYYNPEIGRWVNRDPLTDLSFRRLRVSILRFQEPTEAPVSNLNEVGENQAIDVSDHDGRSYEKTKTQEEPLEAELLPEGPGVYVFVGNNSLSSFDKDGTAVPVVVVGAIIVGRIVIQRVVVAGVGVVGRRYIYQGVTYSTYGLAQMARGRHAHQQYTNLLRGSSWTAPYRLPGGGIPDAARPISCVFRELKPNTVSGIRIGQSQIQRYLNNNPGWNAQQLDVYNVPADVFMRVSR